MAPGAAGRGHGRRLRVRDPAAGDPDRELRTHIVELLNFGECVAVSYAERVGDRRILMASMGRTITRWYRQLRPYVVVTARHRGFDPWEPLAEFVGEVERAAGTTRGTRL